MACGQCCADLSCAFLLAAVAAQFTWVLQLDDVQAQLGLEAVQACLRLEVLSGPGGEPQHSTFLSRKSLSESSCESPGAGASVCMGFLGAIASVGLVNLSGACRCRTCLLFNTTVHKDQLAEAAYRAAHLGEHGLEAGP